MSLPAARLRAACLALLLLPLVAAAQDADPRFEAAAGVSATRNNETTGVASLAWLPAWRDTANGALRWEVGALYVHGRGDVPGFDLDDSVVVGFGGARYEHRSGFTAGGAIGVQAGKTDALSGNPQFVTTAGWQWSRFSLLLRHVSNASIHQPNDGETMLVGAWRF